VKIAKKLLVLTVVLAMVMGLTSATAFANNNVRVVVDGYEVQFEDQGPILVGGHVLAPVRGVFTQMGFTPTWNSSTRVATLTGDGVTIVIPVDGAHFYVNGEAVNPDVPQIMLANRIMLPIGAIAAAVGATLEWNPTERVATITTEVEYDVIEEDEYYDEKDEDYDEEDEYYED